MHLTVAEILKPLQKKYPLVYAEDFDNTGLLIGRYDTVVKGIIVTLDTTEGVLEEAIKKDCNLIISFHPIIFKPLKKLNGTNYVERIVEKAIKKDIAIYTIHTALDNSWDGVSRTICDVLNLKNRTILFPQATTLKKLTTYVPIKQAKHLREVLFEAGAGNLGNYSHCSFNTEGNSTFMGNENSTPKVGEKQKFHTEKEIQIGVVFPKHIENKVLQTLFKNHPYEEVAYEVWTINNQNQAIGMGMVGDLKISISEIAFLKQLKDVFGTPSIRHSKLRKKEISKVAVLGGSGSFAIDKAISSGADIFLSADISYHNFFKGEDKMVIADIGHYESEQYTKNLLHQLLNNYFPNLTIILSETNTNPVYYSN